MNENNDRADELFEALNQQKKRKKRKLLRTILIILVAVLALGFFTVRNLRRRVEQNFADELRQVQTHTVQSGTIHTLVSGSGTLAEVDTETLTVPAGVEIDEVKVEAHQTVKQGDLLATVNMSSVMTALSDVQDTIEALDDEIADARDETAATSVKAGISGRVKRIFAEPEMDVAACMAENGALAILSLDGYMAVEVEAAAAPGDSVTVTREDGSTLTGTVDAVTGGIATILITDNGPRFDEEVTVSAEDGAALGTGRLYIHEPLAVTAYAGTVRSVSVQENGRVSSGSTLFYLKDTQITAGYEALLRERQEQEQTLLQLLTIYRDSAVLAPMDGLICSIEYSDDNTSASAYSGYTTTTSQNQDDTNLLTICPNTQMEVTIGVDETDILALKLGQVAEITVSSVSENAFTGSVTEISREAATTSGVTQYSAVITLDKDSNMLSGMTADVDVRIQGTENALLIPLDALHQTRDTYFVYTGYDEQTQQYTGRVEVTIGMQNDSFVEILSGLTAGDVVYYTESQSSFFMFPMGGMSSMGSRGGSVTFTPSDRAGRGDFPGGGR